jgi:DNA-binding CsgD family transcriptional regulator
MTVLTDFSEQVVADPGPAAELAPMVEVWFRILGDHVPDQDRRCRACSGVRRAAWPCPVRALAERARQWHALGLSGRGRRLPGLRGTSCPLTLREREFLQLAADGWPDPEIAERLDVPERTVRTSIRRIGRAVGAPDRTALLVLALRAGVVV